MTPLTRLAVFAAAAAGMCALGAATGVAIVALEERSNKRLGDGQPEAELARTARVPGVVVRDHLTTGGVDREAETWAVGTEAVTDCRDCECGGTGDGE